MSSRCLLWFVLFGILVGPSGCATGSMIGPPSQVPTPSISSISPTSTVAGGAAFALTVSGSDFISGADIIWTNPGNPGFVGGSATLVSASQLTLQISAADIAIPGSVQVKVLNPNNSSSSNAVAFVIQPGSPGGARVISIGANGGTPNGWSYDPVLSFNGRFVFFISEATNLISPSAKFPQAYVRDTCLGADRCTPSTLLVSAVTGGDANSPVEGNGPTPTGFEGLSPSGVGTPPARYIGFLSTATNLVSPSPTFPQVYVRDTCMAAVTTPPCTPATILASVTETGGEPNGAASSFMFANKTCNLAFVSAGTNIVSGVTVPNQIYLTSCSANGPTGAFTTSATPVSVSSLGVPGDHGGQHPAVSSDGGLVAFDSASTNLTSMSPPYGSPQQIYLRKTCIGQNTGCTSSTTLVSLDSFNNGGPILYAASYFPAISDDGRFVIYTSAGHLMAAFISIYDTCISSSVPVTNCTPSTTMVDGGVDGPGPSTPRAISGDGRFVVFDSAETNLVTPATSGRQVFVRDTCKSSSGTASGCTPQTVLISVDSTDTATGGIGAAISEDGHFAVFQIFIGGVEQIMLAATGF
jgi:hypothetical protein